MTNRNLRYPNSKRQAALVQKADADKVYVFDVGYSNHYLPTYNARATNSSKAGRGDPYRMTVFSQNGRHHACCECKAGEFGVMCKHLAAFTNAVGIHDRVRIMDHAELETYLCSGRLPVWNPDDYEPDEEDEPAAPRMNYQEIREKVEGGKTQT